MGSRLDRIECLLSAFDGASGLAGRASNGGHLVQELRDLLPLLKEWHEAEAECTAATPDEHGNVPTERVWSAHDAVLAWLRGESP